MIPTGAPITLTLANGTKSNGVIFETRHYPHHVSDYLVYVRCGDGGFYTSSSLSETKIRYDKPAPFTLWQLNIWLDFPANCPWPTIPAIHGEAGPSILNPDFVNAHHEIQAL